MQKFFQTIAVAGALLMALAPAALAQKKAGEIRRQMPPSFVRHAAARGAAPAGATLPLRVSLKDKDAIYWNDVLETDQGGRIRAQLNDGSLLNVGSQSRLTVVEYNERTQQSTFQLQYGRVRAQVVRMTRPDSKFEIRTNTAVCGVLGTDEFVEAGPFSTLVVNLSDPNSGSQIVVRNSDNNVPGAVTLNPGEATRVDQGKPPTPNRPADSNEINNALQDTLTNPNPEAALVLQAGGLNVVASPGAVPQVQLGAGADVLLDGRSSTGGTGTVTAYQWAIPRREFQSSDAFVRVLTADWSPGAYEGTLTITTSENKTATARFVLLLAPSQRAAPEATLEALRQAYEALQVRNFMSFFSEDYSGYSALEASVTNSFSNIATNRVFLRRANGSVTGDTAIYQADFEVRFQPKVTALPLGGVAGSGTAAAPMRFAALGGSRARAVTASISGSTGAVATFVTLVGLTTPMRLVANTGNTTNYTFTDLPPGQYEITPARAGFTFNPEKRVVDLTASGLTGQDFTPTAQEQVVRESVTLNMQRAGQIWKVSSLSAPIGSAGLVGIPGVGAPAEGSAVASGTGGNAGVSVTDFTVSVASALAPVARGGASAPVTLTITPLNGFSGDVALDLILPSDITVSSDGVSGSSFKIAVSGGPVTKTFTLSTGANAPLGNVTVGYQATSGTLAKQGTFASFSVYQPAVSAPASAVFAGGFNATVPVTLTTAAGVVTPVNVTLSGAGLTSTTAVINGNGTANLVISSAGSTLGPVTATLTATGAGISATGQVTITRVAPFTMTGPPSLAITAGQASPLSLNVAFASGFTGGGVQVAAPTVNGLSFSPQLVVLQNSGNAAFNVTAAAAGTIAGTFVATVGSFSASVPVTFNASAPVDFAISPIAALNLQAGGSTTITATITQTSGNPVAIAVTASGVDTSKLSVTGGGTTTGSGSVQFTVQALTGIAAGTTTFTITAQSGAITRTATVTVNLSAFDFTLAGASVTLLAGSSTTVNVQVTQTAGSPTPITVSATGVDATRLTVTGGGTVTGTGAVSFGVAASAAAPAGITTFTVNATGGGLTRTATVAVDITTATFTVSATDVTVTAGTTAQTTVQITQTAGTPVLINVAVSGVNTSLITVSPTSGTVTGTGSILLDVTASPGASGSTSFTVTATSGGITHAATVNVIINAVTLTASANPPSLSLLRGSTGQVTINVTSTPLTATVTPAALPSGISAVTVSGSNTVTGTGAVVFNVTAATSSAATSAVVSFIVSTSAQTISVSVPVTLVNGFAISAVVSAASPTTIAAGGNGTQLDVQVTFAAGFTGSVTVTPGTSSVLNATLLTGSNVVTSTTTLHYSLKATGGSTPGTYALAFNATDGSNTASASVQVAVAAAFTLSTPASLGIVATTTQSLVATVTYHSNYTGTVTVSLPGIPALLTSAVVQGVGGISATLTGSGSVTYDLTAGSTTGTGTFTVHAFDSLSNLAVANTALTVTAAPTFSAAAAIRSGQPSTIARGGAGTIVDVSVTGLGSISVTAPTVAGLTFTPLTATTVTSGSGTVSFQVTASSSATLGAQTLTFTVVGPSTLTPSVSITVEAAFTISAASSTSLTASTSQNLGVSIAFSTNYSGSVTVSVTTLPAILASAYVFGGTNTSTVVTASGAVTFVLTASSTPGSGSLVFGASDSFGNSATVSTSVTVVAATPNFTAAAAFDTGAPSSIASGGAGTTVVVTVTYGGSFTGTVAVAPASTPSGFTITPITTTTLTASGTVKFTVTAAAGLAPTTQSITFNAASGATTQTATISIGVVPAFTLTAPSALSLTAGQIGAAQFTVTFNTNYTGTVTVAAPLASPPVAAISLSSGSSATRITTGTVSFDITASGTAGSNSYTFSASDGTGNTATASLGVTVTGSIPAGGSVTAGSASGTAGGSATIPVTLILNSGVNIDSLSFGLTVLGGATPINSTLSWTSDAGNPFGAPSVTNSSYTGRIAVFFSIASSTGVSGTVLLGNVTVPLTSITAGSYTIQVDSANASLGSTNVNLSAGPSSTMTVASSGTVPAGSLTSSSLAIAPQDITFTPAFPKEGDLVTFRVRVTNSSGQDARNSELVLMSRGRVLARERVDVGGNRSSIVNLQWKAEPTAELQIALDPAVTSRRNDSRVVTLRNFGLEHRGGVHSIRRERTSLTARNDNCAGIRLRNALQSSCGGSVDLEISPAITDRATIEVMAAANDGGIVHLGALSLSTIHAAPVEGYQPQGLLEAGHSYALKTRNGYALFRVLRITSSVNPRLAGPGDAERRQRRIGRQPNEDIIDAVRDERTTDRLLDSARITIDIEWLIQEDGSANFQ